jgi:hypothetical protein
VNDYDDDVLRQRLGALAPDAPAAGPAFDRLSPRFERARRRRQARNGALAAIGAAAVVVLAVLLAGGPGRERGVETVGVPDSTTTTETERTTTTETTPTPPPGSQTGEGAPPQDGSATTLPEGGDGASAGPPPTIGSDPGSAPAPAPTPAEQAITFDAVGGSVSVRWSSTTMTLVGVQAGAGFTFEITHEESDRIEVRFESDNHESRVELRLVGGQIDDRIDEQPKSGGSGSGSGD